jgi:prephenate dehydrogenase
VTVLVDRAAVIGLGLIGGSVARELAQRGTRVSGYDVDPNQLEAARRSGVIETALDAALAGIEEVNLIVVAVPVDEAEQVLTLTARCSPLAALITDVGSTKARIVAAAERLGLGARFVGAHPLAGDHRSGWEASRTGLFVDAPVYLCAAADVRPEALTLAERIWRAFGGRPRAIDPAEHDRVLAWTSHLPQAVSTALSLALAGRGVARRDLGSGGRDVTRLAGGSPAMWSAIASENAGEIEQALAAAEREIAALRADLRAQDTEALRARFSQAKEWFER